MKSKSGVLLCCVLTLCLLSATHAQEINSLNKYKYFVLVSAGENGRIPKFDKCKPDAETTIRGLLSRNSISLFSSSYEATNNGAKECDILTCTYTITNGGSSGGGFGFGYTTRITCMLDFRDCQNRSVFSVSGNKTQGIGVGCEGYDKLFEEIMYPYNSYRYNYTSQQAANNSIRQAEPTQFQYNNNSSGYSNNQSQNYSSSNTTGSRKVKIIDKGELYTNFVFSSSETSTILSQISSAEFEKVKIYSGIGNWSSGISSQEQLNKNSSLLSQYNAYVIADFGSNYILKIPSSENKHMPADMQPYTDFYFVITKKGVQENQVSANNNYSGNNNYQANSNQQLTGSANSQNSGLRKAKIVTPLNIITDPTISEEDESFYLKSKIASQEIDLIKIYTKMNRWPSAVSTLSGLSKNIDAFKQYNAYIIGELAGKYILKIPADQNKQMPFELQPTNDFYIVIFRKDVELLNENLAVKSNYTSNSNSSNNNTNVPVIYTQQTYNNNVQPVQNSNSQSSASANVSDVDVNIPATASPNTNRFALIIGNEDYHSNQTGLRAEADVEFAAHDAATFKEYATKVLGVPQDNLIFLTNARLVEMSRSIDKLSLLSKATGGDAEVFFYYAGHGFPDEKTKEAYIIPVDVSGSDLKYALKLKDIYMSLTAYQSKRVTIFLDACFSGGAREEGLLASRGIKIKPKETTISGNEVVFCATSSDQSALAYKAKGHGMFTYFLLKKLQDTKGDVAYGELHEYIQKQVGVKSILENSKEQTPTVVISPSVMESWRGWKMK